MWRGGHRAQRSVASAGCDLVGGIDHGPGSNQPVHHLQAVIYTSSVERSLAVLRCTTRQEVRRESLCCLCQASGHMRGSPFCGGLLGGKAQQLGSFGHRVAKLAMIN